jgi:excinuclease ABC subunit C
VEIKDKIKSLPASSGVYLFKDKVGKHLYIGKAENIRKRVKTHLDSSRQTSKEKIFVQKTASIDYIITSSEVEALILECNLIKEYRPYYNVMLKDDKKYPYVKIALGEEFPTIHVTRDLADKKAKYFGPYTNAKALRKTLSFLRKIFLFKVCSKKKMDGKPCLNYHISRCIGPCTGKITKEEYAQIIKSVSMFLEGKVENLLSYLKKRMDRASGLKEYEKAAQLRDQIDAIQKVSAAQTVSKFGNNAQDFIGYAEDKNKALIALFKVRDGKLLAKEGFNLVKKSGSKINEVLSSFIEQYYSSSSPLPDEIFLPAAVKEKELFEKWFKKTKGKTVEILTPKRGDKKKLLQMASDNAKYRLMEEISSRPEHLNLLMKLKEKLELPLVPSLIEGIDISNIRGKQAVGSVVVFEKGFPKKSKWKKFRIKSIEEPNDYMMMKEVLERKYKRVIDERSKLADMILVDGGRGQVGIAKQVFYGLGIKNIPIIGIAKKENRIYLSYSSRVIKINPRIPSFRLLIRIRDEAHRFAHSYYENLKKKEIKKSLGNEIPTIGRKLEKEIIKRFGSWEKVKKASFDELLQVNGIGQKKAETIKQFFKKKV